MGDFEQCLDVRVVVVFRGTMVHATSEDPMVILEDHALGVDGSKIVFLEKSSALGELHKKFNFKEADIIQLPKNAFLMPGLIDTHIHASQYPNCGVGLDRPLLEWLETYTFPTEAMFAEGKFAEDTYRKCVNRLLQNGTTCACYFGTIHTDSTLKLCDIIEEAGQRAFVGKVNMDQMSPETYCETTQQSVEATERYIQAVLKKKSALITPVITPRFAVSCTSDLMQKLGLLAAKYNLPIQTHLSENKGEIELVEKKLHSNHDNYTAVYDNHGLLSEKTVLAHCIHLSPEERAIIKQRGSGISHCPNSNISIRSGCLDLRQIINEGIKVGLGTDCSGGYSPSILNSIRFACEVSNFVAIQKGDGYKALNHRDMFRLATLGGSQVLGLQDEIGNFEVGKQFDALIITPDCAGSPIDLFDKDSVEDVIQKVMYLGDDRNISAVYVAGKKIHSI